MTDQTPAEVPSKDDVMQQWNEEVNELYLHINNLLKTTLPTIATHHGGNKEVLASTLKIHQQTIQAMRQAEEFITAALIELGVKYEGEQVEGVGFLNIHRTGAKVVTDNELIIGKLKAQLADAFPKVDHDTGEKLPEVDEDIAAIIDLMVAFTGAGTKSFTAWRKGVAKSLGFDVNDYTQTEGGRLVVTIT